MRNTESMLLRWYAPHFAITLLALVFAAFYSMRAVEKLYTERLVADLETQAYLAAQWLGASEGEFLPTAKIQARCRMLGADTGQRWTLLDAEGRVLGDSEGDVTLMARDTHALRPEIREAFRDGSGWSVRYSATVGRNLIYVARRIDYGRLDLDGRTLGVVRVAVSLTQIEQGLVNARQRLWMFFFVLLLLALATGIWVSRRVVLPMDSLRHGLRKVLRGDLDYRIPHPRARNADDMGGDLNSLAQRMQEQIEELAVERSDREAILSSMTEGVLALDANRRIAWINEAAASMLNVPPACPAGLPVQEVLPHAEFLRAVDAAVASAEATEYEVTVNGETPVVLWVHAAPLRNAGVRSGTVFVFSDLTHQRRLERVRKDFVANVSHELKTPVTAIRGALETLQDGTTHDPSTVTRFLDIARRQSALLERIVNDLLLLSRVESKAGRSLEMETLRLNALLQGAIRVCARNADERHVRIERTCGEDIMLRGHASLLEQAIVNLIDNAVKYGPEGATVHVSAQRRDNLARIEVRDCGPGIARRHLDRIFERFYRIDPGRSRDLGGTGLGLSIVRHITEVHGGHIEVESEPGQGSTFILWLPIDSQTAVEAKGDICEDGPP